MPFDLSFAVSYPRLSVDLKIHQLFEFDRKNVKAVALLSSAGLSLLDANIDVAYVPQNPKNFYEIEAKVCQHSLDYNNNRGSFFID